MYFQADNLIKIDRKSIMGVPAMLSGLARLTNLKIIGKYRLFQTNWEFFWRFHNLSTLEVIIRIRKICVFTKPTFRAQDELNWIKIDQFLSKKLFR